MSPGKVLETIHLNFSPDPCTVFQGETVSLTQPLSTLRLGKWLLCVKFNAWGTGNPLVD